jgi:hypothetical protein
MNQAPLKPYFTQRREGVLSTVLYRPELCQGIVLYRCEGAEGQSLSLGRR